MIYGINLRKAFPSSLLIDPQSISKNGSVVIVAPHPDDESLACGGLITLLTALQKKVDVIFISDGSMSHPGSIKYPAKALMELREKEALEALAILGVSPQHAFFLRLKDSAVPRRQTNGFAGAVSKCRILIDELKPSTIILPWRRDPHPDHQATWQLVTAAVEELIISPVTLEYPLWAWERGNEEDLPGADEVSLYTVNISSVLEVKKRAIRAHASQLGKIIDDDPQGFWLSEEVLEHFFKPYETFIGKPTIF